MTSPFEYGTPYTIGYLDESGIQAFHIQTVTVFEFSQSSLIFRRPIKRAMTWSMYFLARYTIHDLNNGQKVRYFDTFFTCILTLVP